MEEVSPKPSRIAITMQDGTKVKFSFRIFMGICIPLSMAYGALYTFIPSQYHRWIHWPFNDPAYTGLLGCVFLSFSLGLILAVKECYWERIRLFIEFSMIWLALTSIFSLWSIFKIAMPPDALPGVIEDTILTSILFTVFLFFYRAQSRIKSM
jgi:hypothetical protein